MVFTEKTCERNYNKCNVMKAYCKCLTVAAHISVISSLVGSVLLGWQQEAEVVNTD